MKATTGTRRSLRAPLLLAACLGLAASTSGCIIDDSGSCDPTIFVPWSLERNLAPVTCASAGAFYVEAFVNSQAFEVDCLAAQTLGTAAIPVAGAGDYTIVMSLLDANRLDVVPPTPAMTVRLQSACGSLTTDEAVFEIP